MSNTVVDIENMEHAADAHAFDGHYVHTIVEGAGRGRCSGVAVGVLLRTFSGRTQVCVDTHAHAYRIVVPPRAPVEFLVMFFDRPAIQSSISS